MWYLFFQIWLWLAGAFALGWYAHWFLCCRKNSGGRKVVPGGDVLTGNTDTSSSAKVTST